METLEPDIPQLFGKNVQKYRKLAGLTQTELSKRLDISQKHLSIIETGTQFASATLIGKISKELNIPPAALFGDDINQDYIEQLYERLSVLITKKADSISTLILNNAGRRHF